MIDLDSSHEFDWALYRDGCERRVSELPTILGFDGWRGSKRDVGPLLADAGRFGRRVPVFLELFFEADFRSVGRRFGIELVGVDDALALRHSFQSIPGLVRFLGEAFAPVLYIGEGATAYTYLPKQSEPCADSFVVLGDQIPAGLEFASFNTARLFALVEAVVAMVRTGSSDRSSSVPLLMKEWLLP